MKKIFTSSSYERLIAFILIVLTWFFTGKYIRDKDAYQASIIGVVEELQFNDRDKNFVQGIKFKNTSKVNELIIFGGYYKSKIHIGDSLYKPMFSNDMYIYRKDSNNKYKFLYIIKNE
ncbi:MAG: hypothetical protein LBP34_01075 [Flavobacteriaceae bacterium]|jgi:hypothetical protein|nr:hypothetical protein [Flavobacteriaceae bacterium]